MIADFGDLAGDRRAVDVHVENIQKDADPRERGRFGDNGDDFAVGRRNRDGTGRNPTIGIAKKVKAEQRENEKRQPEPGAGQVGNERSTSRVRFHAAGDNLAGKRSVLLAAT